MFSPSIITSKKGFSILVGLGTTGVLLIIIIGLATLYQREIRLSRMVYDDILTDARAEGAFEYAMLKVRNHREGFEDRMTEDDIDAVIFSGSTDRTKDIRTSYTIYAQTGSHTFSISPGSHLIIPLFVGTGELLMSEKPSRSPFFSTGVSQVNNLKLDSGNPDISWSIIAMSASENISLVGSGDIDESKIGTMRLQSEMCFDRVGTSISCSGGEVVEERLQYLYDKTGSVIDFLSRKGPFDNIIINEPYILIFHSGQENANITISTVNGRYALPTLQVIAESRKGNSLKSIRFLEDRSRYYDALRYSIYDTD